jgi:hypothetical protein
MEDEEFIKVRCPQEANYYDCNRCKLWNKYSFGCENLKDRWGLFPKKEAKP